MSKKPHIYLIDDNADDNLLHKYLLEKLGIAQSIDIFLSAEKALEAIGDESKTNPDFIFLDLNMPGMSGWDFLKEMKLRNWTHPNLHIIVMLGTSIHPDVAQRVVDEPVLRGSVYKPLTKEDVEEFIIRFS